MPRPRKDTREEILANTRQQLLKAAANEFAREGYVGANINRISKSAGFAKGTIYNHFPSKRALMLALIEEIATTHTDFVLQQVDLEDGPIQRIERFFNAGFTFVEQHPTQTQVIVNAIYGSDDEFKQQAYQAYDRLFTMIIQDIVEAGVTQGDFRPVDSDLTTALIMAIYLGSCSQLDSEGKIWLDPGQVLTFILDGLRPRVPLSEK
jgi:AcrR family transcriptional regulator